MTTWRFGAGLRAGLSGLANRLYRKLRRDADACACLVHESLDEDDTLRAEDLGLRAKGGPAGPAFGSGLGTPRRAPGHGD